MKININKVNELAAEKAKPTNRINIARVEQLEAEKRAVVRTESAPAPKSSTLNREAFDSRVRENYANGAQTINSAASSQRNTDRESFDATVRQNYAGNKLATEQSKTADELLAIANSPERPKANEDIAGFVKDYNSPAVQDKEALLAGWLDSGKITSEQAERIKSAPAQTDVIAEESAEDLVKGAIRKEALQLQDDALVTREQTILNSPDFERYEALGAQSSDNKAVSDMRLKEIYASNDFETLPVVAVERPYIHMLEEEYRIYNYLFGKYGKDSAERYVDEIRERLNERYGHYRAERTKDDNKFFQGVNEFALALEAGADNAVQGIKQSFTDKALATSATQYASDEVYERLANSGFKVPGTGRSISQVLYGTANSVANMTPSIVASLVPGVGAGLAAATTFLGTGGNAYNEALKNGYTKEQARTYSVLIGGAEAALQYLIGGLSNFGGVSSERLLQVAKSLKNPLARVAATAGIKIGAENIEEQIQLWLQPAIEYAILGKEFDAPTFEDMVYTALQTSLSTGALEAGNIVSAGKKPKEQTSAQPQTAQPQEAKTEAQPAATPPSQPTSAPATQQSAAVQKVYEVLSGTASNSKAETILNNGELLQAFKEITGVEPTGTWAQRRAAVKAEFGKTEQTVPQDSVATGDRETQIPTNKFESVGAADAGFTGDTVRGFSKNLATDKARNEQIQEDFSLDPATYFRLGQKDTLAKAEAIFNKGLSEARHVVENALGEAKARGVLPSPEMVPLAKMVADNLAANGDIDGARAILADMAAELTAAGQFTNAAVILREANPASVEAAIQRMLDDINASLKSMSGKKSKWKASLTADDLDLIYSTDYSDESAFEKVYEHIAKRIGAEMPSTLWEKATELRRVAMLLNPKTMARNIIGNIPTRLMGALANRVSGVIQDFAAKMGKLDKKEQTRAGWTSKESKQIAKSVWANEKNNIINGSSRYDLKTMVQKYRHYFGQNKFGQILDGIRSITYGLLEKGDVPFVQAAFRESLAQYIEAHGIKSEADITQAAIDFATEQAYEATFRAASDAAKFINKLKRDGGIAGAAVDTLLPFTSTPINVAKTTFNYSPFGFLKLMSNNLSQAQKVDAFSRATVGTIATALGVLLAQLGIITGSGDDDKDKAAWDKATGNSPFTFGGAIPYDWIQPFGAHLAVGAAISDLIDGDATVGEALYGAATGMGDTLLNMTLFQNVLDVLEGYNGASENILEAVVKNFATQMVPSAVSSLAQAVDPTVRSTYTGKGLVADTAASVMAKIPGLSTLLPESVNVKGEANKRLDSDALRWADRLLNPANVNYEDKSDADAFIESVYEKSGNKAIFPSVAPTSVKGVLDRKLTGEERAQFQKVMGQTYYDMVGELQDNSAFDMLTGEQQGNILENINLYSLDAAKRDLAESLGEKYTSDWDDEAKLDDPAQLFFVKYAAAEALKDKDNRDFDAISALLGTYNKLSNEARDIIDESSTLSRLDDIAEAAAVGIDSEAWYKAYDKWKDIKDNSEGSAYDKADEFAKWVEKTFGKNTKKSNLLRTQLQYSSGFSVGAPEKKK